MRPPAYPHNSKCPHSRHEPTNHRNPRPRPRARLKRTRLAASYRCRPRPRRTVSRGICSPIGSFYPLLSVTDHQTVLTEQNITKALIAIQSAVPPNCLDGAVDAVCRLLGPEGLYAVFVGHLELPSEWISVTERGTLTSEAAAKGVEVTAETNKIGCHISSGTSESVREPISILFRNGPVGVRTRPQQKTALCGLEGVRTPWKGVIFAPSGERRRNAHAGENGMRP